MKNKAFLRSCSLLIAIAAVFGFLASCSREAPQDNDDQEYSWPGYRFEEAVEAADHIVLAKVSEKTANVKRKDVSGQTITDNDIKLEIIDILKSSDIASENTTEIIYHEIPSKGENRADIPQNLQVGQEVILFLNQNSRILGPDYVILVKNNTIELASYLLKKDDGTTATTISVNDFRDMITAN